TLYVAQFNGDVQGTPLKGTGRWLALKWGENGLTAEKGFNSHSSARASLNIGTVFSRLMM
ncbi:hypothetical protein GKC49_16875, partial [Pantoea agglomerans]|nr:hypothetical protein [Pantoea agglomerans]